MNGDVRLRAYRMEDAQGLQVCANNKKVAGNLRDAFPHPYGIEDARAFIGSCLAAESDVQQSAMMLAIEVDGELVGGIGLTRGSDVYRKSAELGYWLAEPFWGRGIMTRCVKEICRMGFEQWDVVRIFAEPYAENLASRRVLEKAGFALEGVRRHSVYKNGELLDDCMYGLVREE